MKVKLLRSSMGISELKGEDSWVADDATKTQISMLPCGHFVVSRFDKHVLIGSGIVTFARVEPENQPAPEVKRGPGRPKAE